MTDRTIELHNPYLQEGLATGKIDVLYHLGLHTGMNFEQMFGDVKFVLMGGSAERAKLIAHKIKNELKLGNLPVGSDLFPVGKTERFFLFKIGPVISVNHGMGQPSLSILLHEIAKLLFYAKATNVAFIRIGTSGGLGVPGGTVCISSGAVDGELKSEYSLPVLGTVRRYPTQLDKDLIEELKAVSTTHHTVTGLTMSTNCFYEGQGRVDGLFCDYTNEDKLEFLKKAHEKGVINIEMESSYFAHFCTRANIQGAIVCVALLDRLQGDQVGTTPEVLAEWVERAADVVLALIRKRLALP